MSVCIVNKTVRGLWDEIDFQEGREKEVSTCGWKQKAVFKSG